jgi:hypothetical protein
METDLAHESTFSPRWHQRESDTANLAADVTASIEAAAAAAIASIKSAADPQILTDDTIDHVANAAASTGVDFTVAGLGHSAIGTVTLSDAADDTITARGNSVLLDTDKGLNPTSSVGPANPTHVPLTMSGLEGDGSGTVTSTDASGKQAVEIPAGETLELTSPYSGTISFDGATGTLKIDNSASFSGKIAGQLAIGDVIDFADITAGASAKLSYSGNNSPGTLTVSDGTHTASVALLGNYSLASFTASSDGHGGTSVVDPPLLGNGSANAPAGAPQFPNLLSGYTVGPAWKVAGVDYAVGIPQGTVLKDAATINMAGVTVDKTNHQIIVTAANITLDGYDFSLAGGWEVITQAANTTISNSSFKIGANHNPLVTGTTGSSNLTVLNCVLDGNNTYDTLDNDLIGDFTPGLTVKYSLLENGYAHFISAVGGQLTLEYNVFNNTGNVNAHPDWLQTQTGDANIPYTETIMYNTAIQTSLASRPPGSGGTQGFMLNDNGSIIANAEFAYNTMLDLPGGQSSPLTSIDGSRLTGSASVHDNFADTSGGNGYGNDSFFADPSSGYTSKSLYYNNINMVTGGLYYQNATGATPTTPIAPQVNPLVVPVATNPN